MADGLDPTESSDGRISVRLLDDGGEREVHRCSSYERAIELVRAHRDSTTVVKIVDRDGEAVFTSAEMHIDTWERQWTLEKRRQGVDVEAYDCPYDSVSCFADDRCVQCKMDSVQDQC